MTITDRERAALCRTRALAEETQRLSDGLKELELRTISSKQIGGLPGMIADGDANVRRMIRLEKARERLKKAEMQLSAGRPCAGADEGRDAAILRGILRGRAAL